MFLFEVTNQKFPHGNLAALFDVEDHRLCESTIKGQLHFDTSFDISHVVI